MNKTLLVSMGFVAAIAVASATTGCGKTDGNAATTIRVYSSTSTAGDFATWTLDGATSPSPFTVQWNVTNSTGAVTETINLSGTCGDPDPTYAYRRCTVNTSDSSHVTVGTLFDMLEFPGVALLVHPESTSGRSGGASGGDEIHVGFTAGSCDSNPVGDYSYVHTAPGGMTDNYEAFGVYRMNDASFTSVTHADFALKHNGTNFTTGYSTGTTNGVETLSGSCSGGVRTMTIDGNTVRGVITQSGLFFLDLPRGDGGIVSFKTDQAASIDDLVGKTVIVMTFGGGSCGSGGDCTDLIRVTLGAKDSNGKVPITSFTSISGDSGPGTFSLAAATNATALGSNSFAGVTGSQSYSGNTLSSTYATPGAVPGLFFTDEASGGNATPTILLAMKSNGKLLFFGSNMRRNASGCTGSGTCYYVGGQFIGFEL